MRNTVLTAKAVVYTGMVLLLPLCLAACTQIGKHIPAAQVRALDDTLAEGEGRFNDDGLRVVYSYDRKGDSLVIRGQVSYSLPVESLDVYLLFIDTGGVVIDQEWVYSTGYSVSRLWGHSRTFERTLHVPDAATAISFYSSAVPSRGHQ
ncbi:MAG TPA: hypothetical protein VJ969_12155 [Desulfopila sp.]|nr:hypothetical protein [Desulfopila sp.]